MRRGAEAARRAHNPEVVGSNPTAATYFPVLLLNLSFLTISCVQ